MKSVRATVLVGLLTLATVAAVLFGVARSSQGVAGEETIALRAWFHDVTGLATGAKVTIAGYKVGQIEDIRLVGNRVQVQVRIIKRIKVFGGDRDPVSGALRHASVLQRLQASFLGDFYLELSPGAAGPLLKDGDFIPIVITATDLQQTLEKIQGASEVIPKITKIADDIGKITDKAARVLGTEEGEARFTEIADNLVKASRDLQMTTLDLRKRLNEGVLAPGGDVERGLRSFANAADKIDHLVDRADRLMATGGGTAERSLTNIELATRSLRDIVGRHGNTAGDTIASLQDTLLSVQKSLGRIDNVVARVEDVVGGVARGEGNVGRLLKDETLIRQTEGVVTNAKQLLDRYTLLEVGLDYRIAAYAQRVQYNDAFSWQSHLSLRLQPRPDRYVKATLTSDNVGKITALRRVTNTSIDGAKSPGVTEQFTETENTFKLGLQYARRLGPITLRGGLIESTAGGGIDLHLWSDRLRIEADLFRFSQLGLTRPRFRLGATVEFIQHVYAWVGGDDLFYPTARADFFYGIGVAFSDDDLKILFAAAPSVSTN